MRRHEVVIEVEDLVLDGWSPEEAEQVRHAIERRLQALVSDGGVPASSAQLDIAELDAGSISGAGTARAEAAGTQVASSLHQALLRGGS